MKNNFKLFQLIIILLFTSCHGQVKPIGEEPLNLENFSFNTKISELLPDKNKSKEYKFGEVYEIQGALHSQIIEKDTVFENKYSKNRKAIGIEYLQKSSTSIDTLAIFENQQFQKINIATTLNGKIKALSAVADELTLKQNSELLKKLISKLGKPKKYINGWNEKLVIHEWTAKNKIIRFVSTYDDESTSMKLVIDENNKTVTSGDKEPHYVGYIFIINSETKDDVFGKMKTGDFVFLDEKK